MAAPRHIFRIHIRGTPEEVWRAITDPGFTRRVLPRLDEVAARDGRASAGRGAQMGAGRRRRRRVAPGAGGRGEQLDVAADQALVRSPDDVDDLLGRGTRPRITGVGPSPEAPRTRLGTPGSCPTSTLCSAMVSSPFTMPTAARRSSTSPGWRTSTSPTPMRAGRAPSPVSAAVTKRGQSGTRPLPSPSPTTRAARSSPETSPPAGGSASLSTPGDATPDRVRPVGTVGS